MMLPRGNVITDAGDPDSVNLDLQDTINCEVLPPLEQAAGKPRGYKYIAAGLRRLAEWRSFMDVHSNSSPSEQTKLLTHSGHGSVSALKLDTTQAKAVSPQCARVMIRRITGSAALGKDQLDSSATCTQCDHPAGSPEALLERHSVRCPNGGQRHYMHAGLVAVIVAILLMAGIPKSSIVVEKKGLRPDRTRPGDVVVLNFYGPGRHLVIDAVISTVYRNTLLSVTSLIPGHVAKLAEDKKFKADELSSQPVSCKHGGDHVFVPFAMEDGGTLGAHTHALLKTLAEHAVSAGRHSSPDSRSPLSPSMQVSLWMQRWQNRLSTWLHVSLSQQILRLYRPAGILSAGL